MNHSDPLVDPEAVTVDAALADGGSVLVALMEQCLAQLEAGADIDRDALVSAHPELASQIDACLASLQFIHQAVQPTAEFPSRLADFRILRELGRGGMGVVYEAEQISLKRRVALKVLRFGAVSDPEAMTRFQREAETVASLHHTNIVPVFAVGVEKSVHYYAMQLIEGSSLREIAQSQPAGSLSTSTISSWGLQAAEALAHAHERSVVHRDIKPGNLILGNDGRIWLTDFGLAKRLDDVTLSLCGALMGTPRYMSPEQASAVRHPVDHRTDIYSLGATLYELVTGRPLFESNSPHIVISQILTVDPTPPREIVPTVPRDLETIILKCLCKDAGRRYQQARELADDLRAFVDGRAIKARRATFVEQTGRWLKQNRRLLTATVAAVALTAAIVVGGSEWSSMQNAARNGKLTLTTKDGPLSGEVLTATGEPVVPSFTIPNEQPILVPEGEHQLRALGRGVLSKTGWLTLNRGTSQEIDINVERPELYPALPLNSLIGYEVVDFGNGPDLIVLPESPNRSDFEVKADSTNPNILSRISGTTGKEIWSLDISQNSSALKELLPTDELRSHWWSSTVFGWKLSNQPPLRVLRPLPDLDADGVPDLIWRLNQGYCLFAVSGKTGRPLWWHSSPMLVAPGSADSSSYTVHRQFGDTALATIRRQDGTAQPTVVVTELGVRTKEGVTATARVFALDARDKSPLWSVDVPGVSPKLTIAASRDDASSTRSIIVVVTETELLKFDLGTGAPIGPSLKLPDGDNSNGNRHSTPRIVDVDADGLPEVLLTHGEQNAPSLGVQLVSLSAKGAGTATSRPNWYLAFPVGEQRKYFVDQYDLNGDGIQEIVLTSERLDFDCRILDGRSGKEIWRRQRRSNFFVGRQSPVAVGDDLNGDGWREVFVASIDCDVTDEPSAGMQDKGHSLFVDCFSGKDGASLWWSKSAVAGKSSGFLHPFTIAPRWWSHGLTGEPSLLISVFLETKFPQTQGYVYTVNATTGRFEEVASDLAAAEPMDLNGDGRDEFIAIKMNGDGTNSHDLNGLSGELRIFQGENPTGWRHFGIWQPLMDLDGDGLSELWQPNHRVNGKLPIISGRHGKQIAEWTSADNMSDCIPLTEPSLDIDGDGLTEVLAIHHPWFQYVSGSSLPNSHALGLDLISPKTQRRFWSAPHVAVPRWTQVEQLQLRVSKPHWKDLDGDGELEILVPYHWQMSKSQSHSLNGQAQFCLMVLDARTGHLKWNAILKEEPSDRNSYWSPQQDWLQSLQFGDLDGDGVQDLLVSFSATPWPSTWKREVVVQPVSGSDGHLLWPEFRAPLYQPPEGLSQQQQEILKKNSALQQFIDKKGGLLRAVIANLDGKSGAEVVRLEFHPDPNPDRPYLDGQFVLSVLDGRSGSVQFENRWPGMIHPHDDTAAQQLLTIHRSDRDVILVAKAKNDLMRRTPLEGEDWLLAIPEGQNGATAQGIPALQVLEVHQTHPDDRVWKFDLDNDRIDELIFWRTSDKRDSSPELVSSRGLNDELWKRPMSRLSGFSSARIRLLEAGKALLVSTGQMNVVLDSDGKLLSRFATPKDSGIEIVPGSEGWISRWAAGQTPRVIVNEGSQTRSDLIYAVNETGRLQQTTQPVPVQISHTPDPRVLRRLPWIRNGNALAVTATSLGSALTLWLLLIAPFQLTRWAWPRRRRVWPAICWTAMAVVWSYAIFRIALSVYALGVNLGSFLAASLTCTAMLLVAVPIACSPPVLIRSIRKNARKGLTQLALAILVATMGLAALFIAMDSSMMHSREAYRLEGWFQILLPGVIFGVWLLIVLHWICQGVLAVMKLRQQRRKSSQRVTGAVV